LGLAVFTAGAVLLLKQLITSIIVGAEMCHRFFGPVTLCSIGGNLATMINRKWDVVEGIATAFEIIYFMELMFIMVTFICNSDENPPRKQK
jgi:hypothetical protein